MDPITITSTTVQLLENDSVSLPPTHSVKLDSIDKKKVIINPNKTILTKTKYTIKVGPGVKDTKGKSLEGEQRWSFTTK